jgi:phage protein D
MVGEIAKEHVLKPVISEKIKPWTIEHLDQSSESDIAFLTRFGETAGAIATVKADRLLFFIPGEGITATGEPLPEIIITRSSGDSHRFNVADREAYTGVRAYYHDVAAAETGEVVVGNDGERTNKETETDQKTQIKELSYVYASKKNAEKGAKSEWAQAQYSGEYTAVRAYYYDPDKSEEGAVLVTDDAVKYETVDMGTDYKNRETEKKKPTDSSADNHLKTIRHIHPNEADAKRAALAAWSRLQRGVAEFSISLALGRPDVQVEAPATVSGFKAVIDAEKWTVVRVTHQVSDQGYTTALEFEVKREDL